MELRHLRYFAVIAELENFSKAAEVLHIAQPALSQRMRDLEAELGLSLFERLGRGAVNRIFQVAFALRREGDQLRYGIDPVRLCAERPGHPD